MPPVPANTAAFVSVNASRSACVSATPPADDVSVAVVRSKPPFATRNPSPRLSDSTPARWNRRVVNAKVCTIGSCPSPVSTVTVTVPGANGAVVDASASRSIAFVQSSGTASTGVTPVRANVPDAVLISSVRLLTPIWKPGIPSRLPPPIRAVSASHCRVSPATSPGFGVTTATASDPLAILIPGPPVMPIRSPSAPFEESWSSGRISSASSVSVASCRSGPPAPVAIVAAFAAVSGPKVPPASTSTSTPCCW